MGLRALFGSRAAVGCTLLGAVAVGAVFAVGWEVTMTLRASAVGTSPAFLGGFGQLLYLVWVLVVTALMSLVWYPFGAGLAYAVGRRVRGGPATLGDALAAVRGAAVPLARWLKTRLAVDPLAERVLVEADVAPNEVVVGCSAFVVPAVVLDSPTSLPRAVERANLVTPQPGRGRTVAAPLAATVGLAVLAVLAFFDPLSSPLFSPETAPTSAALAVLAAVLTVAADTAWRARAYATAESP
jgi:hypothetical protein